MLNEHAAPSLFSLTCLGSGTLELVVQGGCVFDDDARVQRSMPAHL